MTSQFYLSALAGVLFCFFNQDVPPASASDEKPVFELRAGEKFFRANGQLTCALGRNPVGMSPEATDPIGVCGYAQQFHDYQGNVGGERSGTSSAKTTLPFSSALR